MKITSLKTIVLFVIVVIFLLTANVFAAPAIRNVELSTAVAEAESAFADKQYIFAAESYLKAINITNANAHAELNEIKAPFICPYSFILHYERLKKPSKSKKAKNRCF